MKRKKQIEQRNGFYKKMIKTLWSAKKPFMDESDIKIFGEELLKIAYSKTFINILEWGPGYSTKYYADMLDENDIDYFWETIEADKTWYDEFLKFNLKKVRFHLFDEELFRYTDRRDLKKVPMTEYINLPIELGKKYDFIFIDGAKRNKCMKIANEVLEDDGIVMIHDAQRIQYHESMNKYFNNGKFLGEKLWIGTKKFQ